MILVISTINLPCTETGWNSNTVLMMTEKEIERSATSSDFGVLTKGILLEKERSYNCQSQNILKNVRVKRKYFGTEKGVSAL